MATSLDKLSDETFDLLCSPCKRKHVNTEAEKLCVDCSDYYCSVCVKCHEDIPALSGHKILDKGQFQHGTKALPMVPTERCGKHNHKPVDMYCQNHDDVGCSTCMAVEHRSCQDILYIPEYIQSNANITPDPKEVIRTLQTSEKTLTQQSDMFQREKERIAINRAELFEKIERNAEKIKTRIDQLKQHAIRKAGDMYAPVEKLAEQNISRLQSMKSKISSAKDMASFSSGNNVSQAFVSIKKGNKLAFKARQHADECIASFKKVDIEFEEDQNLSILLNEMTSIGKVTQIDTSVSRMKLQRNSSVLYKVINEMKYNVRGSKDRYICYIISACVLGDGTIVLADKNNQKVKRVDSNTYTVTDFCDLPFYPWQVCAVSYQEVAVSCHRAGVQFVSLQPNMTVTREIKPGHTCRGLAYGGGHLYISDMTSVYKYSSAGKKPHQFTTDQQVKQLFKDINNIAESGDGGKIYVADRENGLIALDRTNKIFGTFNGPKLRSAEDVLVTDNGSILVCGYVTKNIVQFGPKCEMIGEVLKSDDKAFGCTSICYSPISSKLIVGRYNTDEIEVYDLI